MATRDNEQRGWKLRKDKTFMCYTIVVTRCVLFNVAEGTRETVLL